MQRSRNDIVVFTGAGISASAGLRTYRGPDGLWNDATIVRAADAATLYSEPEFCWQHWGGLRAQLNKTGPTPAHFALAEAESRLPEGYSLHIVTQNVDGLHTRAGSKNVIEFHGNVRRTRCSNPRCALVPFEDHDPHLDGVPRCELCGSNLRPDIVLFGEQIDRNGSTKIAGARALFKRAGTVIVAGTTLEVSPAKNIVDIKKRSFSGVRTMWINVQPPANNLHCYREKFREPCDAVLPGLMRTLVPVS